VGWGSVCACFTPLVRPSPPPPPPPPPPRRRPQVADLGSLNGTLLNGEPISVAGRKRGRDYRLSTDDILQVGGGRAPGHA
jgi:hypothetical protein